MIHVKLKPESSGCQLSISSNIWLTLVRKHMLQSTSKYCFRCRNKYLFLMLSIRSNYDKSCKCKIQVFNTTVRHANICFFTPCTNDVRNTHFILHQEEKKKNIKIIYNYINLVNKPLLAAVVSEDNAQG